MKYIDIPALEDLNNAFTCINLGDSRVFGRIECYSCKNTNADYKLKSHLRKRFNISEEELSISVSNASPPKNGLSGSYKTFFLLVATLNAVFPDYDFSDIPLESIKIAGLNSIVNNVNMTLLNIGKESFAKSVGESIWTTINSAIQIDECELYQYVPVEEEEENLWSWFYFFFNKKLKRIVFFSCRAVSLMAPLQPEETVYEQESNITPDELYTSISYEEYTMKNMEL